MGKWVATTLEHEILRQKEIEVNNMKSEFVSVASHQLRTPLTGIRWFGELLLKGKAGALTPDQKDFIQQMYDSNSRMINLVNDLLNVSRIETGKKFTIEKKPVDIVPIVASLFTELVALAAQHKVTMQRAPGFPADLTLNVDGEKIRQVLQNLLSNAVKYSKEGGVVIIGCDTSPKTKITFSIKDSGLGIPAAQQSRMFEKFFRADNVKTKETDGTGLGLYIAKAIVEGHGGTISFVSGQDKGTTFSFSLPR
jgi:signal transduction histidine kinase